MAGDTRGGLVAVLQATALFDSHLLGDRRVSHTFGAKFFAEALGASEHTTEADVLAEEKGLLVGSKGDAHGLLRTLGEAFGFGEIKTWSEDEARTHSRTELIALHMFVSSTAPALDPADSTAATAAAAAPSGAEAGGSGEACASPPEVASTSPPMNFSRL